MSTRRPAAVPGLTRCRGRPLVIPELMVGAGGFNEIHRGIPRISRTLLAQRLRLLERAARSGETDRPARRGRGGPSQAHVDPPRDRQNKYPALTARGSRYGSLS